MNDDMETIITPKTIEFSQNVKPMMINKFIQNLNYYISHNNFSHVDHKMNDIKPLPMQDDKYVKVNDGYCPCLNKKCKLIEYMTVFCPGIDLWLLPACNDNMFCIVCHKDIHKKLNITRLRVSTNGKIKLTKP